MMGFPFPWVMWIWYCTSSDHLKKLGPDEGSSKGIQLATMLSLVLSGLTNA